MDPSAFGIAGVQMHVSAGEDNISRMGAYLRHIRTRFPWVRMAVFSELCVRGPNRALAEPLPGPAEEALTALARETGLWLIPGSLFERTAEGIFNTTPVIAPDGSVIARFRKLFPFRPYEQGVESGAEFVVFDVPEVGRFGVSICYDMWFPETTRTLAAMGAEVILHPTLTDTVDRDVELAIARASAAMNQVYFFDINGVGDGGIGRSTIVDPSGHVLHQAAAGPEIMPFEVDLIRLRRERERGMRTLGQPLKSFRDRACDFAVYREPSDYLDSLGPLALPR